MNKPNIYFYISNTTLKRVGLHHPNLPITTVDFKDNFNKFYGVYNWLLQTHIFLNEAKIKTHLVNRVPHKGIIIVHPRSFINDEIKNTNNNLIICIKADRDWQKIADIHIVQNKHELIDSDVYFINHWPQPGLIKRNTQRRCIIERVGYFGHRENLAEEIRSFTFRRKMQNIGIELVFKFDNNHQHDWNDYSNIDIVLAIRTMDTNSYNNKPASKLINAWIAGVPALLGKYESAYNCLYKSKLDYIKISTTDEIIEQILILKNSPKLYMDIIKNGIKRAQQYTVENITKEWIAFLNNVAIPKYYEKSDY